MIQVHQFLRLKLGPRLIVLGAVHGNETCGTIAMRRLIEELGTGILRIGCGSLTLPRQPSPSAASDVSGSTDAAGAGRSAAAL